MDPIEPEATAGDDRPILTPADFPTPAGSARAAALYGTDLALADGRAWTLADFVPALGPVWDRLYDANLLAGRYDLDDVLLAATQLLLANHDLAVDFAAWLVAKADPDALVVAVEAALFGRRDAIVGWSDWAEAALLANGVDPASVPPRMLRPVLDQLVAVGRAAPAGAATTAGRVAAERRELAAKFERAGIRPAGGGPPG